MDVVLLFYAIFYATTDRYFFTRMTGINEWYVCKKHIMSARNALPL